MNSKTRFREEHDVEDSEEKRTDRTEWKTIIEKLLLMMLEQHYSLFWSKNVLARLLFFFKRTHCHQYKVVKLYHFEICRCDFSISWNGFDNMPVNCVGSSRKEKARITFQIQVGSAWNMGKFCWQEEDKPKDQKNKDRYQGLGGSYFCIHFMTPVIFTSLGSGHSQNHKMNINDISHSKRWKKNIRICDLTPDDRS